jgi:hypothetical protein
MFPPIASSWPPSEAAIQKNTDIPVFLLDGRVKPTAVRLNKRAISGRHPRKARLARLIGDPSHSTCKLRYGFRQSLCDFGNDDEDNRKQNEPDSRGPEPGHDSGAKMHRCFNEFPCQRTRLGNQVRGWHRAPQIAAVDSRQLVSVLRLQLLGLLGIIYGRNRPPPRRPPPGSRHGASRPARRTAIAARAGCFPPLARRAQIRRTSRIQVWG